MDRIHGRDIDMTADELRIKVRDALKDAWNNDEDEADAAIRVVLEAAANIAIKHHVAPDTAMTAICVKIAHSHGREIGFEILDLLPQDKQEDAA